MRNVHFIQLRHMQYQKLEQICWEDIMQRLMG